MAETLQFDALMRLGLNEPYPDIFGENRDKPTIYMGDVRWLRRIAFGEPLDRQEMEFFTKTVSSNKLLEFIQKWNAGSSRSRNFITNYNAAEFLAGALANSSPDLCQGANPGDFAKKLFEMANRFIRVAIAADPSQKFMAAYLSATGAYEDNRFSDSAYSTDSFL